MSVESVMPSSHLILCRPLLPPSGFPSIRVFSNESVLRIRWKKDWSFSFSISPPNEYSGLISFRMDWFDLFSVRGTLKSLLQHRSSKVSILWRSAFFIVPTLTSIHDYCGDSLNILVRESFSGGNFWVKIFKTRSLPCDALGETKYEGPMKGRGSCVGEKH